MDAPAPVTDDSRDALVASMVRSRSGLRRWRSAEHLRSAAQRELSEELSHAETDRWCHDFHRAIGIGEPHHYRQRLVDTPNGAVFCGIRFFRGERDRPFVDVIACTEEDVTWEEATRAALRAFAVFKPQSARIAIPDREPPALSAPWRVEPDQVLMVGDATDMGTRTTNAPIDLAAAPLDDAEAFLDAAYRAFSRRDPLLADRVPPATRAQLEECAERGRLDFWMCDDQRAGLIGVAPDELCGLDGWCVIEEVAAPDWIGRGTAARAQHALATHLAAESPESTTIFGTIDVRNGASVTTARRAGRTVGLTWWFVSPG